MSLSRGSAPAPWEDLNAQLQAVQTVYDHLWSEAESAFRHNTPQLDLHLQDWQADQRRGLTLIARPSEDVLKRVEGVLQEAAAKAPGQYIYRPPELHTTILSLLVGSAAWRSHVRRWPDFQRVLAEILPHRPCFELAFRGITASPASVMIQGFPCDNALFRLRDLLRARLKLEGLGEQLDQRFQTITAHLTVLRFGAQLPDWQRLAEWLKTHRHTEFGHTQVTTLQLVWSDWYMSSQRTRVLKKYQLSTGFSR